MPAAVDGESRERTASRRRRCRRARSPPGRDGIPRARWSAAATADQELHGMASKSGSLLRQFTDRLLDGAEARYQGLVWVESPSSARRADGSSYVETRGGRVLAASTG